MLEDENLKCVRGEKSIEEIVKLATESCLRFCSGRITCAVSRLESSEVFIASHKNLSL